MLLQFASDCSDPNNDGLIWPTHLNGSLELVVESVYSGEDFKPFSGVNCGGRGD